MKKPLVAAVQVPQIGTGATMLLHCDMVMATPDATFQMPLQNWRCVRKRSSYLLPAWSVRRAHPCCLLQPTIDANTAAQWGWSGTYPGDSFDNIVAERLAALRHCRQAVRVAKALVRDPLREAVHDAVNREAGEFIKRLMSAEAAEAMMQAFLNAARRISAGCVKRKEISKKEIMTKH